MSVISVCYFVCLDCKTVMPIPDRVLESDGYFFNCNFCGRPISLRNIYQNNELEIIESFGCSYGGKEADPHQSKRLVASTLKKNALEVDSWISDSVSQANVQLDHLGDDIEASIIEGSASRWEIQKQNGENIRYDFFSEVRKAVLEGKILPGDYIVPFEGSKYRIEDYPGTADLFGNQYSKEDVGFREIPEWKPISKRPRRNYESMVYVVLILAILGGLYMVYPHALEYWKLKNGERYIATLSKNPSQKLAIEKSSLVAISEKYFFYPEILTLTSFQESLIAAVGKNSSDIELIGLLSEVFSEIGVLKSSKSDLSRAEELALYIRLIRPESEAYLRSHARFYWRSGLLDKGIKLLTRQNNLSAGAAFLLSKMHSEKNDLQKALIYMSDAYQKDPGNFEFTAGLALINEKLGKIPEAIAFTKKAIDLNPQDQTLLDLLMRLYSQANDFEGIEDFYRSQIAQGKDVENNLYKLVFLMFETKKHEQALRESSNFLSTFPQSSRAAAISRIQSSLRNILMPEPQPAEEEPTQRRPRRRRSRRQ